MTTISLRLSPEETELIKGYAKFYNISVSEFIRQTILKKIEDEDDIEKATKAYSDYLNSGKQSKPVSALWEELGL